MLNVHARAGVSRLVEPTGRRLARLGVTPDTITLVGTVGAVVGALVFFTQGWWFSGALLIWGCVMLDVLDGAVARAGGTSNAFGAVLDSTCDRIVDAAVFGALAWYFARHDQPGLLLASMLCLVLGQLTSYIRARAEGVGLSATVGIAERAERLIIVLVGTGLSGEHLRVPYVQAVALWLLVAASAVTVVQRLAAVRRQTHPVRNAPAGHVEAAGGTDARPDVRPDARPDGRAGHPGTHAAGHHAARHQAAPPLTPPVAPPLPPAAGPAAPGTRSRA